MQLKNIKMEQKSGLQVVCKEGGNIVKQKPYFTLDGRFLLTIKHNQVDIYSVVTGDFVRSCCNSLKPIIDIALCPNEDSFFTCAFDNVVTKWNLETGTEISKIELLIRKKTINTFNILLNSNNTSYKILSSWTIENKSSVGIFSSSSGKLKHDLQNIRLTAKPYHLSVNSNKNNYFVAIVQNNNLHICSLTSETKTKLHLMNAKRYFTTVCCHPTEECVATGDNTGRVLLWRQIFGNVVKTIYHWHSLETKCIDFSQIGTQMYSGGGECVLVKWKVNEPEHKDFIPRLPAAICNITVGPNNNLIAISTTDNGISIIDNQGNVKTTIQNLSWGTDNSQKECLFPAGLQFDPRSQCLVLNSRIGHIQFYSPYSHKLLYNLHVTGQNLLTQERNKKIINADVKKIAIYHSGLWIATVEERKDDIAHAEIFLKFWNFDETSQTWNLNTFVDLPHENGINAIVFRPPKVNKKESDIPTCVTTGKDNKFKIWSLLDTSNIYCKKTSWRCFAACYHCDLPTADAAFSNDGSLLAVGMAQSVTVWVPDTCELKCSLSYTPYHSEVVKNVVFGNADQCHLIVASTENRICVWNLLTLSVIWTVPLNVKFLCSDPESTHVAAVTTDNNLFVFQPVNSNIIYQKDSITTSDEHILDGTFIPNLIENSEVSDFQKNSQLYFITSGQRLLTLEAPNTQKTDLFNLENVAKQSMAHSLYAALDKAQRKTGVQTKQLTERLRVGLPGSASVKDLLAQPSHTTAPMKVLCRPILLSMVTTTLEQNSKKESPEDFPILDTWEIKESDDNDSDTGYLKETLELPIVEKRRKGFISKEVDELNNILNDSFEWVSNLVNDADT